MLGNWYELWKYDMSMNDCYGKLIRDVIVGIELRKIKYVKESEEDVDLWSKKNVCIHDGKRLRVLSRNLELGEECYIQLLK